MSSERINQGPEKEHRPSEDVEQAGNEQREKLHEERIEKAGEQGHETADDARHETEKIFEKAAEVEEKAKVEHREVSPAERRADGPIGKADRDASFKATMSEVRTQMSAPSRVFSKIIHNKTVEKVSEAAGSTVARPNALLSGAVFAFLLTLAVYLVAKNLGYPLSGFESIGAFALGWIIGLIYDFLKVMITGRR